MTTYLWELESGHSPLISTITLVPDQVSGGNENKAVLSGSLKADPNTAELQKVIVDSVSSIPAYVCSTQSLGTLDWGRNTPAVWQSSLLFL